MNISQHASDALRRTVENKTLGLVAVAPMAARELIDAGLATVTGGGRWVAGIDTSIEPTPGGVTFSRVHGFDIQPRWLSTSIEELAKWVIADDERADEEGDCSFRTLLHSTYADDAPDVHGDFSYADEQLVGAGLIASQVDRTEHVETWRTDLGRRVHSLVCAMDRAEGAEDMGWSGRGF